MQGRLWQICRATTNPLLHNSGTSFLKYYDLLFSTMFVSYTRNKNFKVIAAAAAILYFYHTSAT